MKTAVETIDPTRVRLTVEVPFEELKPSLDAAYKRIAGQVNVPGFRKGKVPARIIDQRFGRAVVLEEAVNDAVPRFYGQAVQEHSLQVLGQPEVDVTELDDGTQLKFTAEVDVRPEFDLPPHEGVEVTVEDAEVTDADVDEQLQGLRERFGTLKGVERAAQAGDFVQVDLTATIDGEEVDATSGVSYEIGSGTMLDGLDEALIGAAEGETKVFTTTLAGGEHEGEQAEVTAVVSAVKERELPDLDDDFAQLASEFDTLDELRDDLRARLGRVKRMEQGGAARDKALETYLASVDVPVPDKLLADEIAWRHSNLTQQLEAAGLTRESWLESEGKTADEFDTEIREAAVSSIKAQFVLDKLATQEQLSVTQEELTEHIVRSASRAGMSPDQFAQQAMQHGQVPMLVAEVVRGKALALIVEHARVTDASGREVDLTEVFGTSTAAASAAAVSDDEVVEAETEVVAEAETDEAVEAADGADGDQPEQA